MINIATLKHHIYDVMGFQLQLIEQGIPFQREQSFHPKYHGREMDAVYRVDFLCKGDIVVECKSVMELVNNHRAQLFNYMRLLQCPCGILVNFAPQFAVIERYFYDDEEMKILGVNGQTIHIV